MPNLITDPAFETPATTWPTGYTMNPVTWTSASGVGTVTVAAGSTNRLTVYNVLTAPTAAPALFKVRALVASTSPVRLSVVQGAGKYSSGTTIGAVSAPASSTVAPVEFVTTSPWTSGSLWLRVEHTTTDPAQKLTLISPEVDVYVPPTPEPEPDPEPEHGSPSVALVARLAPLVAAYLGTTDTDQAKASLPVVVEFVKGYTRDQGFGVDGYSPSPGLEAVVISAAARLVSNPEQLAAYATGDYSERPAVFNGYTLAEVGVLHRYRRRAG